MSIWQLPRVREGMSDKEKVLAKWPDACHVTNSCTNRHCITTNTILMLSMWCMNEPEAWADAARRIQENDE